MSKPYRIINMALIFMLIGGVCEDVYALRVPKSDPNHIIEGFKAVSDHNSLGPENLVKKRYECYGAPQGIPLVFISGIGGVTDIYSSQRDSFKEEGFYVVVYHLPLAEEAEAEGKEYSFEFIVQDLHEVMDELGIRKSHIIGTSFGSFVAQYFTIKYPDKVGRLALVSPAAYLELPLRLRMLSKLLPVIPLSLSVRKFAMDVISKKDRSSRSKRKKYHKISMRRTTHKTAIARTNLVRKADISPDLPKIKHDVVIIYGEHDKFMGKRDALRLKEALVNAKVEVVNMESGHLPSWTNPEIFTEELRRFL